jgi:hypothetical protein
MTWAITIGRASPNLKFHKFKKLKNIPEHKAYILLKIYTQNALPNPSICLSLWTTFEIGTSRVYSTAHLIILRVSALMIWAITIGRAYPFKISEIKKLKNIVEYKVEILLKINTQNTLPSPSVSPCGSL